MVEFSRVTKALNAYKRTHIDEIMAAGNAKKSADVEDEIKEFEEVVNRVIKRCKTSTAQEAILKQMAGILNIEKFESTLDVNPKLMGFEDGIYDLESATFRSATPDDRVSRSCGWSYGDMKQITDADRKEFDHALHQIFTDDSIKQYMIDLYSTCLNGKAPQMFQINAGHNNTGGNGKGLLKQWMLKALGQYGCEFNAGLLTQSAGKVSGTNTEMAKLNRVRFAICSEPEQNSQLNGAIIKKMTGGDEIQCRNLYSNNDSFVAQFTLFMECNKKPSVDTEDGGIHRRFRVCEFNSTFTDDTSKIDNKTVFDMDTTLYSQKKMERYSRVWLSKLLENHKKFVTKDGELVEVPEPDVIKQVTKKYFNDTNPFLNFLEENIERTEENVPLTIQVLYKNYTMSEEYKNQSKRARMTKKDCIDALVKSQYGDFFHHPGNKKLTKNHPGNRHSNTLGFHQFIRDEIDEDPLEAGIPQKQPQIGINIFG